MKSEIKFRLKLAREDLEDYHRKGEHIPFRAANLRERINYLEKLLKE